MRCGKLTCMYRCEGCDNFELGDPNYTCYKEKLKCRDCRYFGPSYSVCLTTTVACKLVVKDADCVFEYGLKELGLLE